MKKILFSTMIACLLAFVGCRDEELVNETTNNGNGKKITLTANIAGATDSRVALTPTTDENDKPIVKVAWREYDENNPETFYVAGANGESMFTQVSDTEFSGTLPEPYSDGSYQALYNLDLCSNFGGNKDYTFEQDGTLREQDMMMIASFNEGDTSIEFQHMMSILKPTFRVGEDIVNNTITHIEMGVIVACSTTVVIDVKPTAPATTLENDVYLTIPTIDIPYAPSNFKPGVTFNFAVTANGKDYTGSLTIPQIADWDPVGKLFTATIALTEVNACYLPIGKDFKNAVNEFLRINASLTQIKFIAESTWTPQGTQIEESGAYMVANGTTLEIRTNAEVFMFNEKSSSMFSGNNNIGSRITSIDFNGCINTSNVTTLAYMFQNCSKLTSLNLSGFNTANVTTLKLMFDNCAALQNIIFGNSFSTNKVTAMDYVFRSCLKLTSLDLTGFSFNDNLTTQEMFYYTGGSNATENRIPIKVTETGYNFLKDKTDTNIQNSNAKYVQPDGADWPVSE